MKALGRISFGKMPLVWEPEKSHFGSKKGGDEGACEDPGFSIHTTSFLPMTAPLN